MKHEPDCPKLQFWDAGEHEATCTCSEQWHMNFVPFAWRKNILLAQYEAYAYSVERDEMIPLAKIRASVFESKSDGARAYMARLNERLLKKVEGIREVLKGGGE